MQLALSFAAAFSIFGVTSPYLPILIRASGYGPRMIGLFLGSFEIAGIAGPILTGRIADRFGRFRPALAVSYLLVLVSLVPLVFVRHPLVMFLSLVAFAVGLKSIIPLVDTTATLTLGASGNYGRVRALGSVSFVLVSLFLQFQTWLPLDAPVPIAFWIALTCSGAMLCLPLLPDRAPRSIRSVARDSAPQRKFVNAPFVIGIAVMALSRLAMAPVYSFFSLYAVEELRWNAVGALWSISAASEIPIIFISTKLIARFGAMPLIGLSSLAVAVRLAIYALFPTPAGAVAGQLLHSVCFGLFHPAGINFIATRVPPDRRATGMAIYLSFGFGLPTFIGSSIGGFVVAAAGYRALFASFSVFALASLGLYLFARKSLEAPTRAW